MKCIVRSGKPLRGRIHLPGDKSLSHRAILFSALAEGESEIENVLLAGVTRPMLEALTAFGVGWSLVDRRLTVNGRGLEGWQSPGTVIDCGNSATTMRLLAGAMAATNVSGILDGTAGLRRRPMDRIVRPLQRMGVDIRSTEGFAPLFLSRSERPLRGMEHELSVASAQVKTGLILAALVADSPTHIYEPARSRDHTERMLRSMGAEIETGPVEGGSYVYQTRVRPLSSSLKPLRMRLPGDVSSAAFFVVSGLVVPDSEIEIENVGLNPTRTGLLDTLLEMQAILEAEETSVEGGEPCGRIRVRFSSLNASKVSGERVVRMIDEFPVLGVAAAYARGETLVADAQELRYKESDRIARLCQELRKLGVEATETQDGFRIVGKGRVEGGTVEAHGDHRLAMALIVAGLASKEP
ncbi:MAG: 3-phosphoshikimate 1-carboxyvinyltransferase, partial [Anaerolineales bacterium]|nr:3-phosphoshikimate 1-carboxyvinyltransferase [Anaerolineales bacterium]MDW8445814.1 3-phosphoshikimate 1-carboxyvinyltransferase [Anaerolineales bacterium]